MGVGRVPRGGGDNLLAYRCLYIPWFFLISSQFSTQLPPKVESVLHARYRVHKHNYIIFPGYHSVFETESRILNCLYSLSLGFRSAFIPARIKS